MKCSCLLNSHPYLGAKKVRQLFKTIVNGFWAMFTNVGLYADISIDKVVKILGYVCPRTDLVMNIVTD